MKTKTINCLLFSELNAEQKKRVIENYQYINIDCNWYSFTLDDWKEKLERQGFLSPEIYFSGFYSQGDGASFTADIDLEKFLSGRRVKVKYVTELALYKETGDNVVITTSGHYSHEYTMSIDSDNLSAELEDFILEEAREQARKIYRDLRAEYEYLMTDEAISETLEVNGYYFNHETLKIETV